MKIFNDILEKHTYICSKKEVYKINEDIEMTIYNKGNKVVMWAFNYKTDRFVNLGTKKFKKLMDGFKLVANDMYSKDYYYYITLDNKNGNTIADDDVKQLDIEELQRKVACLNDIITKLEERNKKLESDVDRYRQDYLHYHGAWAELHDREFKRTLENIDQLKKNSLMHNARGAGRKSKFTDEEIQAIRTSKQEGNSIRQIAKDFKCSVGLVHKIINEPSQDTCNFVLVEKDKNKMFEEFNKHRHEELD